MSAAREQPTMHFASQALWRSWLSEHHRSSSGLWVKFAKRGSNVDSVTHGEALDVALCHGWIDGQIKGLDERWWLQRFTPRSRRSKWSQVNCARALELIELGDMQPAGHAAIELAKADGRWDAAYAPQSTATVPDDLQRELDARPGALAFFASLDSKNRYSILHRIHDAKRPETRARRIAKFVAMLEEGRKIHP